MGRTKGRVLSALALSLIPVTFILLRESQKVAALYGDDDAQYPRLSHIPEGVGFGILICALRRVLQPAFQSIGRRVLSPKRRTSIDRVERFATVLFKFIYFLVITVIGWHLMKNEAWFPAVLGGNGSTVHCYRGYPNQVLSSSTRLYYMIQLGYHIHSFLYLVAYSTKRNDFLEMLVHHSCAILLMAFSYLFNYVRIGSLVLFVHDIGDVFGYAIKTSVDTSYMALTLTIYASLLVSWAYTRLYAYPFYILHSATWESTSEVSEHKICHNAFAVMLWILQMLHIYWYVLFLKMGYIVAFTGKADDIQQQCKKGKLEDSTNKTREEKQD